jgi:hypothetical protein
MTTTDDGSRSPERSIAHEIITASCARPTDRVTIAGTQHVEILIELIRRGFSDVLCRSADLGPRLPTPPADILIALDVKCEADLRSVLTRLGRDLRPRGVLVVTYAQTCSSFDERRLRRLLIEGGFTAVERIAGRGDAGTLWCARKPPAAMRRAA